MIEGEIVAREMEAYISQARFQLISTRWRSPAGQSENVI